MGITLPTKTLHLEVGDKISLRAHNGKYLSVIGRPVNVMAVAPPSPPTKTY